MTSLGNQLLAQTAFIEGIKSQIINPIIAFLIAISVIYFLYGVFEYFTNPKELDKAKRHIMWGLIGLFIMVSFGGIINIVAETVTSVL